MVGSLYEPQKATPRGGWPFCWVYLSFGRLPPLR